MLRLVGVLLLMAGSIGLGWSIKEKWKASLEVLYQMRQIFEMLQNEIAYSRASLPEACGRIGGRVEEPYRGAFISIRHEMLANRGLPFFTIWKEEMEECMKMPSLRILFGTERLRRKIHEFYLERKCFSATF